MTRRRWAILIGAFAAALVFAAVALWSAATLLRPSTLKARAVAVLSERLGLDVELEALSVSIFPMPGIDGRKLVLRVRNHPELPPFVSVDRFHLDAGIQNLMGGHFHTARLDGLRIFIPPSDARPDLLPSGDAGSGRPSRLFIDRVETPNAELTVLRRRAGDPPLVFRIHELTMMDVGFDRSIPFHATLTNPVPLGLVDSTGRIGPFPKGRPSDLPVSGDYSFTSADLDTIHGLAGVLNASGSYEGVVSRINVTGTTTMPDFSLDLGGKPLPLTATYETIVDGTDGTTTLRRVSARLLNTDLQVAGVIDNLPGPGNHDIRLNARITKGRIEDLLKLVADAEPALTGDVVLDAKVALPPSNARVRDRLRILGTLQLAAARFTRTEVQAKIAELSRRGQGKPQNKAPADLPVTDILSDVKSGFELTQGVLKVSGLRFDVPGAEIRLDGSYSALTSELDMSGEARTDASLSRLVGGWKGLLVKPFDFVLRKEGAGAVIPIAVSGTRDSPQLKIRLGAIFTRGSGS